MTSSKMIAVNIDINSTVGTIIGGSIDDFLTKDDMEIINKKISVLNEKLDSFNLFDYKLVNRIKIRNLIIKTLSEESQVFIDLAVELLNESEENFENIIDSFLKLTKNDIDVLYYNLWKKRGNKKYDVNSLKNEIGNNFEFVPDLIMSYEYRVNKDDFISNENGLILGNTLTLMPETESSNVFNVFEKLAFNNFIRLSKYIPNKKSDSFNTYLCFNFTYLGLYFCKIMKKIEKSEEKNE